jgi:hypothetical protein
MALPFICRYHLDTTTIVHPKPRAMEKLFCLFSLSRLCHRAPEGRQSVTWGGHMYKPGDDAGRGKSLRKRTRSGRPWYSFSLFMAPARVAHLSYISQCLNGILNRTPTRKVMTRGAPGISDHCSSIESLIFLRYSISRAVGYKRYCQPLYTRSP